MECNTCHKEIVTPENSCTTGYAMNAKGEKLCYACCAVIDRESMVQHGDSKRLPLYLDEAKEQVTNWPGTLTFPCWGFYRYPHNIAKNQTHVWFKGPDSFVWHGRQYGEWTQIVHCKRTRVKAQ